ncbi:MAG: lysylphosphatidylglycerol synthase domain-containing protein [Chloroflexota bacterium]
MKQLWERIDRKEVWNGLKLALVLALLAGFFYFVPLDQILEVLKTVDLVPLAWTLVISMAAIYITSMELWVLTHKQGISLSVHRLFLLNLSIRFYSFFSPVSSLGTLLRWQRLSDGGKGAQGLVAIAANRMLDIIIAVAVGLFWGISALNKDVISLPMSLAYLVIFLFLLWLGLKISAPLAAWSARRSEATHNRWVARGFHWAAKLFTSLDMYRSFTWLEILTLTFTAILGELVTLLAFVLIALSVHISISVVDLGWMRSLMFLAALTPFTLAGGVGLREVSTVLIMAGLGIPADQAAAFSLLVYARSMVVGLIGGAFELVSLLLDRWKRPA